MVWIKRCPGILVKLRIEIATKLYYLLEARSIKFLQIHSDYPDRIVVQDYSSRYTRNNNSNNNSLCDEVIGASSSTFACQIHDVFSGWSFFDSCPVYPTGYHGSSVRGTFRLLFFTEYRNDKRRSIYLLYMFS